MEAASARRPGTLIRDASAAVAEPPPRGPEAHPIDGVVNCSCCGRYPLVGERVTRHVGRKGDGWACASCESDGRGDRLGTIAESDRVRSLGGANNVRRAA